MNPCLSSGGEQGKVSEYWKYIKRGNGKNGLEAMEIRSLSVLFESACLCSIWLRHTLECGEACGFPESGDSAGSGRSIPIQQYLKSGRVIGRCLSKV
jgi:hypothetical protein